jgi:hypothetical protein
VDSGLLNVFHDRADYGHLTVGNAIDVHFDCIFEEAIDQHRPVRRHFNRARHVTAQILLIVNELHGATTEDERRANQNGITNLVGDGHCFVATDG